MSTESIASPPRAAGTGQSCPSCGAALAEDQRYCLECGERCAPSSALLGGTASSAASQSPPTSPPIPGRSSSGTAGKRPSNALSVIAGVGVLLLAMGVGILIGRSSSAKQAAPPAQVITVNSAPAASSSAGSEASFSSDWPAGTSGYTVQLQTLSASSPVSTVEAAKSAATAKGAKGVGALKSEEFSSLPSGNYVIYSGVYHKRSQAEAALPALKKKFPAAKVIAVSNSGSSASEASSSSSGSSGSGVGYNESKPAPPAVVKKESTTKGKRYVEESKNLPDVISTG